MRTPVALTIVLASCLVASAQAQTDIHAIVYASGFSQPIAIVQDPTDRSVQLVVQQDGRIRVVQDGAPQATDFLNLAGSISAGGERGLLGMAFAPDYATSGRFYVNFTNPSGHTVVARFKRTVNPRIADSASRFDLRWNGAAGPAYIAQPFSNHNGGHLAFGPDGYLYIGMGDGGSGDDPDSRAQAPADLLGKMLRVDVNVPDGDAIGYRIPANNPFVAGAGPAGTRGEIWAFGLRNPWRFSFDNPARGGTGALLIADVGQNQWEEVNYEPAAHGGRNYGWRIREGAHAHITAPPPAYGPLSDPAAEYDHASGQSITGGYVYRGSRLPPAYRGRYFFADFVQGRVWSVALAIGPTGEAQASGQAEHTAAFSSSGAPGNVSSFGLDADDELFIVSYSRGVVLRVENTAPSPPKGVRIVR